MKSLYSQLVIPEGDKATSITEKEGEFIYDFLQKNQITKTLEVGFAYGCSTTYIISATNEKHYVIDPFQDSYSNLGLRNIQRLNLEKYLIFIKDFSHYVLPRLAQEGLKINFAFIDGGHKFDDIFIDFYFVDLLLNHNGYVLFHDSWLQSTRLAASWIVKNKKNYCKIKIPIENLVLFRKEGDDDRDWRHFKYF